MSLKFKIGDRVRKKDYHKFFGVVVDRRVEDWNQIKEGAGTNNMIRVSPAKGSDRGPGLIMELDENLLEIDK